MTSTLSRALALCALVSLGACGHESGPASTSVHLEFNAPAGADGGPTARVAASGEVLLDDVVPNGVLEVDGATAGAAWIELWKARAEPWPVEAVRGRPSCLRDPALLREAADAVDAALAGRDRIDLVSLAREASMTVRSNPSDWCLCDRCVAIIRGAVRADAGEGGLAAWNEAAGTDAAAWSDVRPWTTAEALAHVRGRDRSEWRLAPWMLARAYQDATFAETVGALAEHVRKRRPGVRVGLTGLPPAAAFGGVDPLQLVAVCDFVEPDPRGLDLPLFRDLFGRSDAVLQRPDGRGGITGKWLAWRGVARGAGATLRTIPVGFFRDEREAAVVDELATSARWDGGIRIVVSHPSRAIRWLIDTADTEPEQWTRRIGDETVLRGSGARSRTAAWRALAGRGARWMDSRTLIEPSSLDGVRVVVLPDALCLDDPELDALRAFAARGGRLVADVPPGTFDTLGNGRSEPPLRNLDGLTLDPGFERLADVVGPGPVEVLAETVRRHPLPVDVGVFVSSDGGLRVVAVPDHNATWDHTTASGVPNEIAEWTLTPGDGWRIEPVAPWAAVGRVVGRSEVVFDLIPE